MYVHKRLTLGRDGSAEMMVVWTIVVSAEIVSSSHLGGKFWRLQSQMDWVRI